MRGDEHQGEGSIASSHSSIESMSAKPTKVSTPAEQTAQPPGDHREDAREEQRLGAGEDGVDAVVQCR